MTASGWRRWPSLLTFAAVMFLRAAASTAGEAGVRVGDAYARVSADGRQWTIGTAAVELVLQCAEGRFRLVSYQNRLVNPPREYVDPSRAAAPFALQPTASPAGRFVVEAVWAKFLPNPARFDPADDKLQLDVKKGDMIGFSVGPHGDFSGDETEWITTVDYGSERFTSSQDARLEQGPVWYYYVHRAGTGQLEPIDGVEMLPYAEEKVRIPTAASGWRAGGGTPHVGPTRMHPSPQADAVRAWRAPRDGRVAIRGQAKHFKGYGDTDVKVLRIREKPPGYVPPPQPEDPWTLESGKARQVTAGGRPAVQIDLTLRHQQLRARYHLLAYPRTAVLRQWVELENAGASPIALTSPTPLCLHLRSEATERLTHYWLIGGNSGPTQGLLQTREVTAPYHQGIEGQMTDESTPWMAVKRQGRPGDGSFVALEYLGAWRLALDREKGDAMILGASIPELYSRSLRGGERLELPLVTLGVFSRDLDDMAARLYDWQYEYLWDYTHDDWHALMSYPVAWWPESRNLQENFAGRLGRLDVDGVDTMRGMGFELLWDDAGWSESPNIWTPTREGPDFAQTLRYLDKTGMKWCLWFCGRPSAGLMDTKVGSWGNFQWRTDGVGGFDVLSDPAYRGQITRFLRLHPRSSFHTCNGGGRYAHTFEIQRYTDVNYFSDAGRGEQTNHYFSYLDTPDKWLDIITAYEKGGKVEADRGRMILTMAPTWYLRMTPQDQEQVRRIGEIYHFLLREGVAGRWSYVTHPEVRGDVEHQYFQRTSHDRTKACIIIKHKAPGEVTIFPRGLLPGHKYVVGFDSHRSTAIRTGDDLMTKGIRLRSPPPGELVYLGLPNRPRGGADKVAPEEPGRAFSRRETNLGHTGVGVYWSPGKDDVGIGYYEVRRDEQVLGKVATGTYCFDHAPGWNPQARYAVRAVDGDGNASPWRTAEPLRDEPLEAACLGGHFAEAGREGWRAETTADGRRYAAMTWVPPVKDSAGDLGGNANQIGGAEGYWEGPGKARVGRGWQQAASDFACVRTWVASQPGTVRILGRAMKEYYRRKEGGPLRVRILHGDAQVWPKQDWAVVPVGDLAGASHDVTLAVARGDAIRFVLEKAAKPESAVLAWMPRIVYAPGETAARSGASAVRILCGAAKPYTDRCGNVWSADAFYRGGGPVGTTAAIGGATPTAADQALYQAGRAGSEFSYAIPVTPGLYSIRLKLAEPKLDWFFERPMNLDINGRRVLSNFDVCHAARGPRRAYERVFRYLVPDAAGRLVLRFTTGWDPLKTCDDAIVQAIEVLPEQKSMVRIDAGAARPWIDWNGFPWAADGCFQGGRPLESAVAVAQASPTLYDQQLYRTARAGKQFQYKVPVTPGLYTVHLKFAELWLQETARRPMNVEINGRPVWEQWDPAAAAGQPNMAADLRVEDVAPDAAGCITVRIIAAGAKDAILQAIEIQ